MSEKIKKVEYTAGDVVYKADGSPYETQKAAAMASGKLKKDGVIESRTAELSNKSGWVIQVIRTAKVGRVPLHKRNKLRAQDEPGYTHRFFNDTGTRIIDAEDAGWVACEMQSMADRTLGQATAGIGSKASLPVGNGVNAVLMKKRIDWYKEDYAEKQAESEAKTSAAVDTTRRDGIVDFQQQVRTTFV